MVSMPLFVGLTSDSSEVVGFVVFFIFSARLATVRTFLIFTCIPSVASARTILIRLLAYLNHPSRSSFLLEPTPRAKSSSGSVVGGERHASQKTSNVRSASARSTPSTPANSARMCTLAPAALEKQRAPMAIVKERIAQRREASGSARKHARSVRLPRSGCCPRVHTRRYRLCRR